MTRKLIEQMLSALQNCANGEDDVLLTRDALDAARAYLAQPEQSEPVAWKYEERGREWITDDLFEAQRENDGKLTPLYTQPKAPEPLLKEIENKLPGGRRTEPMESMRLADYNEGWNDYRKAARAVLAAQRSKE